jgi:hypothetical protein
LIGGIAGAVTAALGAGYAAAIAGGKLGELVDQKVLKSWRCHGCEHRFKNPAS